MKAFLECLETRTFFSAHSHGAEERVHSSHSEVHAEQSQAALLFKGTMSTSAGVTFANVTVSVRAAGVNYIAEVVVTNQAGKSTKLTAKLDSNAAFTFDRNSDGRTLHLAGALNTDRTGITGTFTDQRKDGSTTGTFTLTRVTELPKKNEGPMPTPKPTPPPASTEFKYSGNWTFNSGLSYKADATVKKAEGSTGYTLELTLTLPNGAKMSMHFLTDNTGHFTLDRTDTPEQFHLEGQIRPTTISGTFASQKPDGTSNGGTFALSRA